MSRAFLLRGAAAGVLVAAACGGGAEAPRVAIATNLAVPKGVLDRVTKLTLTVLEGTVSCDETATGQTSLPEGTGAAKEIARRELVPGACAGGAKFCGDLSIEKSDAIRVFSAVAKGDGDATLAIGCKASKIDQDALPIAIKMFRYVEPPVCDDGRIQPTEQCEPPGGVLCDDDCLTKEIQLSIGSGQNGTQTGGPNDKLNPFLLWPAQTGTAGRMFAFYTDKALSNGNIDVALRAMGDDMAPLTTPPALAAGSIFLPNGPTFPPPPSPREQSMPQAAFLGGKYYVVFQDNDTPGPTNGQDIRLRSMDGALVAEQGATPIGINGGTDGSGEPAIQAAPAIAAGPQSRLFIAWEDAAQGKIAGRTFTPPSTLGPQNDISTGTGNKGVSIAATPTGWVAVWQSGTGVKLRAISDTGTPSGSEQTVNDGGSVSERPRVASLPDGRFAVVWSSAGDVFAQRYDAKGAKIAGDQASAINDVVKDGDQITPAIAPAPAGGGAYVAVWLDAGTSDVRGRMLGGTSGFLFNNENGQSTEFKASRAAGRTRANPSVAVGGAGPFVAIAWEDKTSGGSGTGIVARRFPLPSE
ncbi:MAG: hypothetical protein KF819_07640 [Labilithrix sp.]|nr:hypothetical protein [Labilithrix sp.]